ncbi:MAG TPA: septum formation initiator family protein [Gaiellales bacterium]|nr:septum formation initiator family protein [Gaiellales bacterium]
MASASSTAARPHGLRMGRLVAAVVLVVVAALYVGPIEKYLRVQRDLHQQRALVSELSTRRQELLCDVRNLHTKHAMVELARRAGWVLRGETLVVVNDVPDLPDNPC